MNPMNHESHESPVESVPMADIDISILWLLPTLIVGGVLESLRRYFTARADERAKIDTAIANLDKLAKQVEVVTEKAETIKTQLAAGEWNRQWILDRRRDVYAEIVKCVYKLISDLDIQQTLNAEVRGGNVAAIQKSQELFNQSTEPTAKRMREAQAVAALFASTEAHTALNAMCLAYEGPHTAAEELVLRTRTALVNGLLSFLDAARRDLGVPGDFAMVEFPDQG